MHLNKQWMREHWVELAALGTAILGLVYILFRSRSSGTAASTISYPAPAPGGQVSGGSSGGSSGDSGTQQAPLDLSPITDAITALSQQNAATYAQLAQAQQDQNASLSQTFAQELAHIEADMAAQQTAQNSSFLQALQAQQAQEAQYFQQLQQSEHADYAALLAALAQSQSAASAAARTGATTSSAPPAPPVLGGGAITPAPVIWPDFHLAGVYQIGPAPVIGAPLPPTGPSPVQPIIPPPPPPPPAPSPAPAPPQSGGLQSPIGNPTHPVYPV